MKQKDEMVLSTWAPKEVKTDVDKFIDKYNTFNINFNTISMGNLDGYYHLFESFRRGKAYLTGSNNQILVIKRKQAFVLKNNSCTDDDIKLLGEIQKRVAIYSEEDLSLPKGSEQNEIVYNIPYILDPANYKNSRQRNRRVKRPFKWANNNKIEIIEMPKSIEDVESLHTEWVGRRIENPKIYTRFFPKKNYLHIFKRFLEVPDGVNYRGIFFYGNLNGKEELLSFRIISQVDNWGYDLTNIARYWCDPNVSNYCYILGLKYFYDNFGIDYFNCGIFYNKSLGEFKKKYPHTFKPLYLYGRNKQPAPMTKLSEYYG